MSDPVFMASTQLPTPLFLTAQRLNTLEPRAKQSVRGAIMYALAYAAMMLFDAPNILLHVMLVPPCLAAAWFAGEAVRRTPDRRTRYAWRIVSLALLLQALADGGWTYFELIGRTTMWDRWSHAPGLVITPLWLLAVITFPRGRRSKADATRFTLDALTVVSAAAMIVWHFILSPILAGDIGREDIMIYTVYSGLDLITLVAAASMLLQDPGLTLRRSSWWIATGLMVGFVANTMWSVLNMRYAPMIAQVTDVLRIGGYLMVSLGCVVGWADARGTTIVARGALLRARFSIVPYVAVAMGYGLLFVMALRETYHITDLVVGAVVLTSLVMARQLTAVRENMRLYVEQTAKETEARFRSLVQHSSDVFAILDPLGIIRYVSPAAERVFGTSADRMVNRTLAELVHEADRGAYESHFSASLMGSSSLTHIGCRMIRTDGEWMRTETVATNLLADQNVNGIVLTIRDVTERVTLEEHLRHQALHDPLTGLGNRALFQDRVAHGLARAERTKDEVAVIFLDLDNFKEINDSLGHAAGDAVLVQTANRVRTCLRDSDTAARFGGDEFAILLEQTRGEGEVMDVANRISAALARPLQVEGKDVDLNASIGIARAQPQQSADEVLRNADVAMYHAKARGKACAVLYESGMHAAVLDRIELQADLRKALERNELTLVYQPIVELGTQQIIGAEALVRWNHPYRGMVSPADFIPLAEETGIIVEIGEWVLKTAATEAANWPVPPGQQPVTITVNLSARQMVDGNFIEIVKKTLQQSRLDADRLVLELTESMLVGRSTDTLALLHRIRALGVRLAIDDFGTGYSSLGYLSQYPLDVLKIDRSFVQGMDHGPNGRALASAVVALGRSLKLKVVAEGIERAEQEWDLRNLGCDFGQGYLYSRPISAYQIAEMLLVGELGAQRTGQPQKALTGPLIGNKASALGTPMALAAMHAAHQPVTAAITQQSAPTSLDSIMPDIPGAIAVERTIVLPRS
ncbi:MAG: EAL domain-containing protein [Gemmatimonadaceae bacterium]|nr:EAL domain-containing protein [Gemmatimonadaceae bacterium]